jgi:hypothetical protein
MTAVAAAPNTRRRMNACPGDTAGQEFARSLDAAWAGGSDERPDRAMDAQLIFAPDGALVPLALAGVRKGGEISPSGQPCQYRRVRAVSLILVNPTSALRTNSSYSMLGMCQAPRSRQIRSHFMKSDNLMVSMSLQTRLDSERPADLDRALHAQMARLTQGISPASMVSAYLDWLVHLAMSPGKQAQLLSKVQRKAATHPAATCWPPEDKAAVCGNVDLPQDRRAPAADTETVRSTAGVFHVRTNSCPYRWQPHINARH